MTTMLRFAAAMALLAAPPVRAEDPQIVHTSPRVAEGQDLVFNASLPGELSVVGNVFWRRRGDVNYQSVQMKTHGTNLTAKIPGDKIHADIEYYIDLYYGRQLDKEVSFRDAESPMLLSLTKPATAAPPPPVPVQATNSAPAPAVRAHSSWPIWVGVGAAAVVGGTIAAVLLTRGKTVDEPSSVFNSR